MHVKSKRSAEQGTKSLKGKAKTYTLSRLHRACFYAGQLVGLLQEHPNLNSNIEGLLEARAYQIGLCGALCFEKQEWDKSLQHYSEARLLYTTLATWKGAKREDLFRDLLSTTIDPSIRYAAYRLKLPRTISIDDIVARKIPRVGNAFIEEVLKRNPEALTNTSVSKKKSGGGGAGTAVQTIDWRSRRVNIEDASTAQALEAVTVAEAALEESLSINETSSPQDKAASYDQVLLPSQDAVDATKTAIDELLAEGVSQSDHRMQSLQITRTAVNYSLIKWRIGRNRILCGGQDGALFETIPTKAVKKGKGKGQTESLTEETTGHKIKRLRERLVLYDASLQSFDAAKELPGVAADAALMEELEAQQAYFAALRCLAIARSHALLHKDKEALALCSRASDLCLKPLSSSSLPPSESKKPPNIEVNRPQVETLAELLKGLIIHYRALGELNNITSASIAATAKHVVLPPFVDRLHEYPISGVDLTRLVQYPPKVVTVPVKPLFLDVAYNYIEYPGKFQKNSGRTLNGVATSAAEQEDKQESKKGWFGFGR